MYRRLFDLQKMTGKSYAYGPVKGMGITAGVDWNTKNDGYEYWKNKFGNVYTGGAGKGAFAKTPFLKAEYHF